MDRIQYHQKMREEVEESISKQQAPPPATPSRPPSASSSPSHEFSFTISLHPQPTKAKPPTTTPPPPPPFNAAIDLSPADEIFFHGHLLPLQLLAHLPVSPRSSTNSLDSFTLPIKELLLDDHQNDTTTTTTSTNITTNSSELLLQKDSSRTSCRSKSFSLFGRQKWRKGCDQEEREKEDHGEKKQLRFEVSRLLKKYIRMVRPLLSFRGIRTRSNMEHHGQIPYSYSGNILSSRGKPGLRGRRGELSAPASMRTSPTNSGLLLAMSGTITPTKSTSDSTMEELQAAIQAAIAHCKNSIAVNEEKIVGC